MCYKNTANRKKNLAKLSDNYDPNLIKKPQTDLTEIKRLISLTLSIIITVLSIRVIIINIINGNPLVYADADLTNISASTTQDKLLKP